jgi:hypothetical protein
MSIGGWRSINEQQLTELFRKLGAQNPEGWAHSQIREGIPQLARYLFLREAWRCVISPDSRNWMVDVRPSRPDEPGGELQPAIDRILAAGARLEDLTTVVRVMQWWLLAGFCELLDEPADLESEISDLAWRLVLLDENGVPTEPINALHESVLETDPTGREMRPTRP